MSAPGYTLAPSAWAPLPRPHEPGSRVLVTERYVEHRDVVLRAPRNKRSRDATALRARERRKAGNWASGSAADQSVRDRAKGPPQLTAGEMRRAGRA